MLAIVAELTDRHVPEAVAAALVGLAVDRTAVAVAGSAAAVADAHTGGLAELGAVGRIRGLVAELAGITDLTGSVVGDAVTAGLVRLAVGAAVVAAAGIAAAIADAGAYGGIVGAVGAVGTLLAVVADLVDIFEPVAAELERLAVGAAPVAIARVAAGVLEGGADAAVGGADGAVGALLAVVALLVGVHLAVAAALELAVRATAIAVGGVVVVADLANEAVDDVVAAGLVGRAVGTAAILVLDVAVVASFIAIDDLVAAVVGDADVLTRRAATADGTDQAVGAVDAVARETGADREHHRRKTHGDDQTGDYCEFSPVHCLPQNLNAVERPTVPGPSMGTTATGGGSVLLLLS